MPQRWLPILLLALAGCWNTDKPTPKPAPAPKPEHVSIVVLYDPAAVDDLAAYIDPSLGTYAREHQCALRIEPTNVVDESGKVPPAYLKPYCDFAAGKQLPIAMIGSGGKVLKSVEQPIGAAPIIALVEKTASEADVANAIFAGGQWRKLGLGKPKAGASKRWPAEGSNQAEPLIPADKWTDVTLAYLSNRILDQGQHSSCCPTSGCAALELFAVRSGLTGAAWHLSPWDIYARFANSDSGADLESFWQEATTNGVCTSDYCTEQGGGFPPGHKDGYQKSRAKHKALRVTYCDGWEAMAAALQRRKPVHYGLLVTSGFQPVSSGVIGPRHGRGGGGHAVLAVGMKRIGGEWYVLTQNSWGTSWGGSTDGSVPKGMALIHSSWIQPAFGIFALGSVTCPSDDPIAYSPSDALTFPSPRGANAQQYPRSAAIRAGRELLETGFASAL